MLHRLGRVMKKTQRSGRIDSQFVKDIRRTSPMLWKPTGKNLQNHLNHFKHLSVIFHNRDAEVFVRECLRPLIRTRVKCTSFWGVCMCLSADNEALLQLALLVEYREDADSPPLYPVRGPLGAPAARVARSHGTSDPWPFRSTSPSCLPLVDRSIV